MMNFFKIVNDTMSETFDLVKFSTTNFFDFLLLFFQTIVLKCFIQIIECTKSVCGEVCEEIKRRSQTVHCRWKQILCELL